MNGVRGHAFINTDGPVRHSFDREILSTHHRVSSEPVRESIIGQQVRDCVAQADRVVDAGKDAAFAVFDHLGDPAGFRRGNRHAESQCVEEHRPHPFFSRAQRCHVGGSEQLVGVGPIASHMQHMLKTESLNLRLDVGSKRTVSNEKRMRFRKAFVQACHRTNEVDGILVADELGNLNHERSIAWDAKRGQRVSTRRYYRSVCVDSIRNNVDSVSVDSAPLEHPRDRIRDRDDRRRSTVFPSRPGVRPQRKIDASRNNEMHRRSKRHECPDSNSVRRMRVNDVDSVFQHLAAQSNRRARVDLEARTAVDDGETLLRRPEVESFARARSHDRNIPSTRELTGEPERLSLTASPPAFGIDVQDSIVHGAQLPWPGRCTQGSRSTPPAITAR